VVFNYPIEDIWARKCKR